MHGSSQKILAISPNLFLDAVKIMNMLVRDDPKLPRSVKVALKANAEVGGSIHGREIPPCLMGSVPYRARKRSHVGQTKLKIHEYVTS